MRRILTNVMVLWMLPVLMTSAVQLITAMVGAGGTQLSWLGGQVVAAECKQERRRVPTIGKKTFEVLQEAQLMIDPERFNQDNPDQAVEGVKSDPAGALAVLREGKEKKGLNSYEVAQFWNMMAYAYYTLGDSNNTLRAYREVLKGEISLALELSTLRRLFQLYMIQEDYDTALDYLGRWEKVNCEQDPGMIYFKAYIYLQKGDKRRALQYALEVERVAIAQQRKMKEDWWYLQVILYNENKDYDNVINVLEKLITHYQKKRYWVHLSGMYSEKGREDAALSAAYAAYIQGMFDRETEIVVLAQRLLNAEVPYEAAVILEKGFKDEIVTENEKNLKLLAQAYTMAREMDKAITAWRNATRHGKDGELHYRLAQALTNEGRHDEAIKSYRDALKRGGLKDPADVSFWLGISLINAKEWDDAIDAFKDTIKLDEEKEKQCTQYINYVESEKRRIKAIEDLLNS